MKMRYTLFLCLLFSTLETKSQSYRSKKPLKEQAPVYRKSKKDCCAKKSLTVGELTVSGNSCLQNVMVSCNEIVNGTLTVNGELRVNGSSITPCANGCITTPATSTDNAIVLFSGTTGKSLKQSTAPVTIDATNSMNGISNITMSGNLNMVSSPDTLTAGVITKENLPFIHDGGEGTSTFVGLNAGIAGTFFQNTGIGSNTLQSITNGRENTAVGTQALQKNSTGSFNTALGTNAQILNQSGPFNTAVGHNALGGNTAGQGNVALGADALIGSTQDRNVALGFQAGSALTAGSNNVYIGANAGPSLLNPVESDTIRVGTVAHTSCFVEGIFNQAPGANATAVLVGSDGKLGVAVSSHKYKEEIKDIGEVSNNLSKLRPVTFKYKPDIDPTATIQYGLIAEEVAEIFPDLVTYNKEEQPEAVKYHLLNILLLNELNKVTKKQEEQERTIEELLQRITYLERTITN